jgi:acetyl esterase/lipase
MQHGRQLGQHNHLLHHPDIREGVAHGLDSSRMAVAGESVGGNTDAAMDTASYDELAVGYYLSRQSMEWFWDAYIPDIATRSEITASPNQATLEQVAGLPPTLLLVDEADVPRDALGTG